MSAKLPSVPGLRASHRAFFRLGFRLGVRLGFRSGMRPSLRLSLTLLALSGPLSLANVAHASNGNKPRVQARWQPPAECIQSVDKAVQPSINLGYDFQGPDDIRPANSVDEVPDSRLHQFFAMCQHRHRQTLVPRWINRSDVDRAIAFGFPMTDPGPLGVIDSHPQWASCALRITPDTARVPITHAQSALGVTWDLGPVPTGSYVIDAYTWEPPENLWSSPSRPGVIRVWDSRVEATPPPAAAFDAKPSIGFRGDPQTLSGCIAADPGSVVTWSFAVMPGAGQEPQWVPMGPPQPAAPGPFSLPFVHPPFDSAVGAAKFMVKADVLDPSGRTYTAYSRSDIMVLEPTDSQFEYVPPPLEDDEGCRSSVTGLSRQGVGAVWSLILVGAAMGRLRRNRGTRRRSQR